MIPNRNESSIQIFVSYSRRDKKIRSILLDFLSGLEKEYDVKFWYDEKELGAGDKITPEIESALTLSSVAILLISQWFMDSQYIQEVELPRILNLHESNSLDIFPIIVSNSNYIKKYDWIKDIHFLPSNGKTLINCYETESEKSEINYQIRENLEKIIKKNNNSVKETNPISFNYQSYSNIVDKDEELFSKVKYYYTYGDITAAIYMFEGRNGFSVNLPVKYIFEIIAMEQSYGRVKSARQKYEAIAKRDYGNYNIKFRVLNIKLLSQERKFDEILKLYNNFYNELINTNNKHFIPAICHRASIAFALSGEINNSKQALNLSKNVSVQEQYSHSLITCQVFETIIQRFFADNPNIFDLEKKVIECQFEYLRQPLNANQFQANVFKSVLQCLFLEAAIFTGDPLLRKKYKYRIIIASLLIKFANVECEAEGYSELLSCIGDITIRRIFSLAMSTIDKDKIEFLKEIEAEDYLEDCHEALDIIHSSSPNLEAWKNLRHLINRIDKKYYP